jgi:hypothetical protein
MRTIKHHTLGEVEVIVEVMHKEKHFFLVKRRVKKETTKHWFSRMTDTKEVPARSWEKSTEHHYCLWGNTNDPEKMGSTKILTKNGNKPRSTTINKYFFEMVNASEKITFKK